MESFRKTRGKSELRKTHHKQISKFHLFFLEARQLIGINLPPCNSADQKMHKNVKTVNYYLQLMEINLQFPP